MVTGASDDPDADLVTDADPDPFAAASECPDVALVIDADPLAIDTEREPPDGVRFA